MSTPIEYIETQRTAGRVHERAARRAVELLEGCPPPDVIDELLGGLELIWFPDLRLWVRGNGEAVGVFR